MAKLPDVTALGQRPTPQIQISGGGFSTLSRASGALAQAQTSDGFEGLQRAAQTLTQGQARIQSRQDAVSRARDYNDFYEKGVQEFQRILTEDDISKPAAGERYGQFLRDAYDKALSGHSGTEESRLMLQERLEGIKQTLVNQAVTASLDAQHKIVTDHIGGSINRLSMKTFQNPGSLVEQFRALDSEIDNMAPALRPEQERQFRMIGRERLTESAIGSMIGRGQIEEAKSFLAMPAVGELLGEQSQTRINNQLIAAEKAIREAETSGLRTRQQFRALFGRDPANDEELFQFIGKPGAKPDMQTEEVADAESPTGTRIIPRSLAMRGNLTPQDLAKYPAGKPPSGLNVEFGPGGTVKSITTGRQQQAGAMTPKTTGDIENRLVSAQEGLARLSDIQTKFKPEFQTYVGRGSAWWSSVREKAGSKLDPGEKKHLEDFAAYKRDALNNINLYIKDITGAQMSGYEIDRLKAGLPDPGTGVFDGDSPSEFQSKMTATVRSLRLASARYAWAIRKGIDPVNSGVQLGDMEGIMRARQKEMETEIKQTTPDIAPDVLSKLLRERLAKEFGL